MDYRRWLEDLRRLLDLAELVDQGVRAMPPREQWFYQVAVGTLAEESGLWLTQERSLPSRLASWIWHATVDGDFRFAAWNSGLWDLRGFDP